MTGTPRPTGRREVTDALLDAASRLLLERNPASVTVRDISRAADVNHGLVHHYFKGKRDLIVAVLDRHAQALAAGVGTNTDLRESIASMFFGPEAQAYARLLAYARVEGWVDVGDLDGFVTRRLIELTESDTGSVDGRSTRLRVGVVLALMLGWEVFGPIVVGLAGIDDDGSLDEKLLDVAMRFLVEAS